MQNQSFSPQGLRESGQVVTTVLQHGGLGLGYLMDGQVYVTTGNGGVILAADDVFGTENYYADGGAAYRARACRMVR